MNIHELTLATANLAALSHFYTQVLGLPASEATAGRLALQAGTTRLTFVQAQPSAQPYYHFAFNIPSQSFAAAETWLRPRGPLLADQYGTDVFHSTSWNASMVYFLDPAGNILELIARHSLTTTFEPPFGPEHLLCVSEIGVVTEDVDATAQTLAGVGLAEYRGPGSDTFNAIGNEQGLCIVVRRGRVWFPDTGRPAVFAPLDMLVSVVPDGPRYQLIDMPPQVRPAGQN